MRVYELMSKLSEMAAGDHLIISYSARPEQIIKDAEDNGDGTITIDFDIASAHADCSVIELRRV